MKPAGGLKLALEADKHDDRRARFAVVALVGLGGDDEVSLITDSGGRLRYRLPPGRYRLRLDHGGETEFIVGERGWTLVRVRLP